MSGLIQPVLALGVRFVLKNQAYETTFVDATTLRYASCIDGRPRRMPVQTFWELVDDNAIWFLNMNDEPSTIPQTKHRLFRLSEYQRVEMQRRYEYVKQSMWTPGKRCGRKHLIATIRCVAERTSDPSPPAPSTLARWIKKYSEANCDVILLAPQDVMKGSRTKKFPLHVESLIAQSMCDDYLRLERPSIEQIYCNIAGRVRCDPDFVNENVMLPSRRTVYRRIKELDPYVTAMKRHGKRYADLHFRAAGASLGASRLMEVVMMDGHRMDIIVVDGETGEILGRPNLVCLFDVFTRAVVGWYISLLPFCATTALAAIKDMCCRDPTKGPGGVPEGIVPDNGPDLACAALRNLCAKICMHVHPAKSYSPDDKAQIERFFRTVNQQLVHMLPGTTFASPTHRGDYDAVKNVTFTLDQVRDLFEKWLTGTYHCHVHSTTRRAPQLAWRDGQAQLPILSFSKEDIDVIARVSFRRKISNGRVVVDGLNYKSNALATLEMRDLRDVIVLVDELNLEFVYVQRDDDPNTLIRADCTRIEYSKGLTKYEHDEVQNRLAALSQRDRDELGSFSYEISRWKLWCEIHDLANTKSAKRLKLLTGGANRKTVAKEKMAVAKTEAQLAAEGEPQMPCSENQSEAKSLPSESNFDDAPNSLIEGQTQANTSADSSSSCEFDVYEI